MITVPENIPKYFIPDIESGISISVSKEQYDAWQNALRLISKTITKGKGIIFITGTGGEINNKGLEEMFYKPDNYNLEKWEDMNGNIMFEISTNEPLEEFLDKKKKK